MRGIGTDVVSVSRIEQVLRRTPAFAAGVFSAAERSDCETRRAPAVHYALRFAAKEAFLKALGLGVHGGVALPDVEVRCADGGAQLSLGPTAAAALGRFGGGTPHLSISHGGDAALAVVVVP